MTRLPSGLSVCLFIPPVEVYRFRSESYIWVCVNPHSYCRHCRSDDRCDKTDVIFVVFLIKLSKIFFYYRRGYRRRFLSPGIGPTKLEITLYHSCHCCCSSAEEKTSDRQKASKSNASVFDLCVTCGRNLTHVVLRKYFFCPVYVFLNYTIMCFHDFLHEFPADPQSRESSSCLSKRGYLFDSKKN